MEAIEALAELKVYPIPAKDYLHIQLRWTSAQPFSMGIYDMTGRLLQQWSEGATKNYDQHKPIGGLSAGTYMLRVAAGPGHLDRAFQVQ